MSSRRQAGGAWLDAPYRLAYRLGYRLAKAWWRLTRPTGRGAATALICEQRILVIRHSYMPGLGLPAGGIDAGETPVMAARRELREEVGIDLPASAFEPAFAFTYHAHGRRIDNWVFEAKVAREIAPRIDHRELVWAGWCGLDELDGERCLPNLRRYREWRVKELARPAG